MTKLGRRLSRYVADLQTIFGKRTVRRFAFDPETDIVLTDSKPHSGSCCNNPQPKPFSHELWVWAQLSNKPSVGTYGGTMSYDASGAGVAAGLFWDRIHDPATLQDHSPQLEQFWKQIDHITHEFEHAFFAGIGEYYNLAQVGDSTGIEPILDIRKQIDDPYWSENSEYFADPLLHNAWRNPLVGSPTTYADLLAAVDLAPVTAAVVNCAARFNLDETVHDLSKTRIRVVDHETGAPIAGAQVFAWNTVTARPYQSEARLAGERTRADGTVDFPWSCCRQPGACTSCFNGRAKLIKVFADGHQPAVQLFSMFDAQRIKLVELQPQPVIEVRLARIRDDEAILTAMAD